MADKTNIEWTDATWNVITGCSVDSPGCKHCYAMKLAGTRLKHHSSRKGLTKLVNGNHVWTGEVRFNDEWLDLPLLWKKPRMIFVCAHGDLFHENSPDEWIDKVFAIMALCPQHSFQVLTKRAERMRRYFNNIGGTQRRDWVMSKIGEITGKHTIKSFDWPLPNVWLGVSVEDQKRADERIPYLLDTPAAVRWLSVEPMLGPIDIGPWISTCYECAATCGLRLSSHPDIEICTECSLECGPDTEPIFSEGCPECGGELDPVCPGCGHTMVYQHPDTPVIDWVVCGGESGPKARPMHPDWPRSIRDQCKAADVPFMFKQWGEWLPGEPAAQLPFWEFQDGGYEDGHLLPDIDCDKNWCEDWADDEFNRQAIFHRVGKARAGRLLDGVIHDGFPERSA